MDSVYSGMYFRRIVQRTKVKLVLDIMFCHVSGNRKVKSLV